MFTLEGNTSAMHQHTRRDVLALPHDHIDFTLLWYYRIPESSAYLLSNDLWLRTCWVHQSGKSISSHCSCIVSSNLFTSGKPQWSL